MLYNMCVFHEPMAITVQGWRLFQYLPLLDSPYRWNIRIHVFMLSVLAAGLIFCSAGLFESSVRYSSYAKYRLNEVPLGDFNFKIRH